MDNLLNDFKKIKDVLDTSLVLGDKMVISDDLTLIPIIKVKTSVFNVKSDIKGNVDGNTMNLNLEPVCFIEVRPSGIRIHNISEHFKMFDLKNKTDDLFQNISKMFDLDQILKKDEAN